MSCACHKTKRTCSGIALIFSAIILLAISFAATSIIGAIIVEALTFFFSLMLTTTACLVKRITNYNN